MRLSAHRLRLAPHIHLLRIEVESQGLISQGARFWGPSRLIDLTPQGARDTEDKRKGGFEVVYHGGDQVGDIGEVPLKRIHQIQKCLDNYGSILAAVFFRT